MHTAHFTEIVVPENRMRKEFDVSAHQDLKHSITQHGVIHPLTIRQREDGKKELLAGERRFRAMQELLAEGLLLKCDGEWLPSKHVPFLYSGEVSDIEALEIELEENVVRRDLTAIETVRARKKLFELRKLQAAADGKTYTQADLAKELEAAGVSDSSQKQISRQLVVAQFLDNPAVAGAKTIGDAEKAAKKATESFFAEVLGERLAKAPPPRHELIVGDSIDELKLLEANVFDCVCTDPPYGIGIDDAGSMVTHDHHYDDSPEVLERIIETVPYQLYRITRQLAHVYWFCDLRKFHYITAALEDAGFDTYHRPIIWWKRGKAMAPDSTRWPKSEYECIVYAIKGDKPPLKVAGDVISTAYGSELQQAEKPKELYVELLSRSLMEGSKVIDPFAGSGVIFSAADALKSSAVGIEKNAARADLARIRAYGL